MVCRWWTETVTVRRAGVKESRGASVPDWERSSVHEVRGCDVQPSTSTRDFEGRTTQVTDGFILYAPYGADIREGDRIEWRGTVYEIDGAPYPWRSPTGRLSFLQAKLVDWRG